MVAGGDRLRVTEIPITFSDRARGTSKIGLAQLAIYGRRLLVLAGGAVSLGTAARFAAVGVLGVGVDYLAFMTLLALGTSLVLAHVTSFVLATIFNFVLNSRWSFAQSRKIAGYSGWIQYARFLVVCLLALFFRGGVLGLAMNNWGWPPQVAILLAIAAASIVNYLGSAFFVFPSTSGNIARSVRWRVLAIAVLCYAVLLRFVFLGEVDLIPQEAYYWNYAQHLDFGYLDHPPLVAWFIWLGTTLAGNTEFAVRIGAFLSWLVAAFFCFQLTQNLYGKTAAFVAVMLLSTLPFFFFTGSLMTPDAMLTAAWAGSLYFLERALIGGRPKAWLGAGVCLGVGLIAKYTIALLGPATLALLLVDPGLRRWLWRPWPYLAELIATLIFSPVILWNFLNDWASFSFQSVERLQEPNEFALPLLVGSIVLLLTPVGVVAALRMLVNAPPPRNWSIDRRALFVAVYTLVPLLIITCFSLFHEVKLNWTGPVWLALLPALARTIVTDKPDGSPANVKSYGAWLTTVAVALIVYGGALHYFTLGLPGVRLPPQMFLKELPVGWEEFGTEIEKLVSEIERTTGKEPLRVGMDQYLLSSEMAFYGARDAVQNTAGRSLFGVDSLMYNRWFPKEFC